MYDVFKILKCNTKIWIFCHSTASNIAQCRKDILLTKVICTALRIHMWNECYFRSQLCTVRLLYWTGTTWYNEMKFGMNDDAAGAGSITWPAVQCTITMLQLSCINRGKIITLLFMHKNIKSIHLVHLYVLHSGGKYGVPTRHKLNHMCPCNWVWSGQDIVHLIIQCQEGGPWCSLHLHSEYGLCDPFDGERGAYDRIYYATLLLGGWLTCQQETATGCTMTLVINE